MGRTHRLDASVDKKNINPASIVLAVRQNGSRDLLRKSRPDVSKLLACAGMDQCFLGNAAWNQFLQSFREFSVVPGGVFPDGHADRFQIIDG